MSVYGDVQLSVQIGELFPIKTWSCLENVNCKRPEQGQRHFEAMFKSYFFVHLKDLDASHTKFLQLVTRKTISIGYLLSLIS